MNLRMAQCASLFLNCIVRIHDRGMAGTTCGVALQAEEIHVAEFQHVNIGSAVRDMTGGASFYPYRRVFVHEWPALIRVALEADGIAIRRGSHLTHLVVRFPNSI